MRGSEVEADRSLRNAPAGNAEQHGLRRCHDAAGLRSAEGQQFQERAELDRPAERLCATGDRADDQLHCRRPVLVQPSPAARGCAGRQPRGGVPQFAFPSVDYHPAGDERPLRRLSARRRSRRDVRHSPDYDRHAERAVVDSRAARSPQFRVAGKRGLSGLRTRVRNGDGRRRSIRCTIHVVPGLWRASGGLVGGPALAAENELASSISAKVSSFAMANRPAMGLGIKPQNRVVRV